MCIKIINLFSFKNSLVLASRTNFSIRKMEFFEKAHIVRSKHSSGDKKSAEIVKKQLKQMLYGYKHSNNQIIKDSLNIKPDVDESSSVSGFSDLNLTSSSTEDNLNAAESFQSFNNSVSNTNEKVAMSTDSDNEKNINNMDFPLGSDSMSDTQALETEIKSDSNYLQSDSEISLNSDVTNSSLSSSEIFDLNGELAEKIHHRLLTKNKNCKRKRDNHIVTNYIESIKNGSVLSGKTDSDNYTKHPKVTKKSFDDKSLTYKHVHKKNTKCKSPPFISITAEDMPCENFNDVLGDYKHSTIKCVPTNHQNNIDVSDLGFNLTTNENSNSEDLQEEVSSLVPEIDEEVSLDDIESSIDTTQGERLSIKDNSLDLSDEYLSTQKKQNDINRKIKIFYIKNNCILVLKHPSEVYIQGRVKIRALGGHIKVFGTTLKDVKYELYAPYYSYALSVKTEVNENSYYGLFNKLTTSGLTVAQAENIVVSIGPNDGVIYLERFESKKGNFLERNFPLTNLFVKPFKHKDLHLVDASEVLRCSLFPKTPLKYLKEDPIWMQAQQFASKERSIGIVCGGKGVGKSTYLRYQINKLIERGPVLVLDLDPGQCEFTVAGNISATVVTEPLLGPNFTHLKKPDMMFNIGMINVMDNVNLYVVAIQRLIFYCRNSDCLQNMPWIINTMGMTNTVGMKLMAIIIMLSKPTYVLQYNSKLQKKCFDMYLDMESIKWFYNDNRHDRLFRNITFSEDLDYAFILSEECAKQGKSSYSLTPKDERFLNFLSYFSELVNIYKNENILAITPYKINLKDIFIFANIKIKRENIADVINGKIVALCVNAEQTPVDARAACPPCDMPCDTPLVCHGHGLVRAVDREKGMLYITTPVPHEQLAPVNSLMYADWTPEIGNFETHLPAGTGVPYCAMARPHDRHLMTSPRRRFNPLQLINKGLVN